MIVFRGGVGTLVTGNVGVGVGVLVAFPFHKKKKRMLRVTITKSTTASKPYGLLGL